jgi:hypothetical protein
MIDYKWGMWRCTLVDLCKRASEASERLWRGSAGICATVCYAVLSEAGVSQVGRDDCKFMINEVVLVGVQSFGRCISVFTDQKFDLFRALFRSWYDEIVDW